MEMAGGGNDFQSSDKNMVKNMAEIAGAAVRLEGGEIHMQVAGHVSEEVGAAGQPGVEITGQQDRTVMAVKFLFQLAHLPFEFIDPHEVDGMDVENKQLLVAEFQGVSNGGQRWHLWKTT